VVDLFLITLALAREWHTQKKKRKKEKTPVKEVFVAGTKAGCKILWTGKRSLIIFLQHTKMQSKCWFG